MVRTHNHQFAGTQDKLLVLTLQTLNFFLAFLLVLSLLFFSFLQGIIVSIKSALTHSHDSTNGWQDLQEQQATACATLVQERAAPLPVLWFRKMWDSLNCVMSGLLTRLTLDC